MHDQATIGRRTRCRSVLALLAVAMLVAAACSSNTTPTSGTASGAAPSTDPASAASTPGSATSTPGSAPGTTVAASGQGPARPSAGCASPPEAGLVQADTPTTETIDVGGAPRSFRRFVPSGLKPTTPAPLVIDLHGLGGNAIRQAATSDWEGLARNENFIVLTPQGAGTPPSWKSTMTPGNADTAFLGQLIDDTSAALCIDAGRVYANGISNGGLESSILACSLSDRVAAVGLVSGITVPAGCETERPMPMVVFWGRKDCVLPFYGGVGPCLGGDRTQPVPTEPQPGVVSVEEAVGKWAGRNHCDATPTSAAISEHVEKRTWPGCQDSAVEFYIVSNGAHTWPGSKAILARAQNPDNPEGITTDEIDATTLMWDYFKRFQLPATP